MFENLFLTLIMNLNLNVFVPLLIMSSGPSNFVIPYVAYRAACFFFWFVSIKKVQKGVN